MATHEPDRPETDLDPTDWTGTRDLAHSMVNDMFDYLETVRVRPAWQPVPGFVRDAFEEPVPVAGEDLASVYRRFRTDILPYPTGNIHPRFWGWVMGTGTVAGMMSELLAGAMNCHVAGYDQSALYVERQVIRWLCEIMGYPQQASGLLVSGATAANLTGLIVARHATATFDVRGEGHGAPVAPSLTIYASTETHSWINKACEVMGLGRQAFRPIPVDADWRIDVNACRCAICADIDAGFAPFCIVATAGTVNTGAIDDIAALRALADEFGLWLHIDGAFGSMAALSSERKLVEAQGLADSLAFDLHKWGYMPYEIGVLLVRDGNLQRETFAGADGKAPNYLLSAPRGISVDATYFADLGVELSRGFRALKAWISFKHYGTRLIGEVISKNIRQARHLADLVLAHDRLELLAPVALNVVCFRYFLPGLSEADLNELNSEILIRVQESGAAVPSQTFLGECFAIRVCNTNHRSRSSDFEVLVDSVVEAGNALAGQFGAYTAASQGLSS